MVDGLRVKQQYQCCTQDGMSHQKPTSQLKINQIQLVQERE